MTRRFNPRARTGRDSDPGRRTVGGSQFQPTRPHGARPRAARGRLPQVPVSTHAPARGATAHDALDRLLDVVSTHAPARGATATENPAKTIRPEVSTHAPARGATNTRMTPSAASITFQPTRPHGARRTCPRRRPACGGSFNPRARTGRDLPRRTMVGAIGRFNPRARTGRDGRPSRACRRGRCFNPRARTGRDAPAQKSLDIISDQFQPTRPHGARLFCTYPRSPLVAFQPTRPHGARQVMTVAFGRINLFQPTRPHGARHLRCAALRCAALRCAVVGGGLGVSTHAPARGATRPSWRPRCAWRVSTHAPARGATGRRTTRSTRSTCFNPRARTGRDAGSV